MRLKMQFNLPPITLRSPAAAHTHTHISASDREKNPRRVEFLHCEYANKPPRQWAAAAASQCTHTQTQSFSSPLDNNNARCENWIFSRPPRSNNKPKLITKKHRRRRDKENLICACARDTIPSAREFSHWKCAEQQQQHAVPIKAAAAPRVSLLSMCIGAASPIVPARIVHAHLYSHHTSEHLILFPCELAAATAIYWLSFALDGVAGMRSNYCAYIVRCSSSRGGYSG